MRSSITSDETPSLTIALTSSAQKRLWRSNMTRRHACGGMGVSTESSVPSGMSGLFDGAASVSTTSTRGAGRERG